MAHSSVKGARLVALKALERVTAGGAYADIVLERALVGLGDAERNLATELVYGVLRWQIKIDWIIDSFSAIKTKKLEHLVLNALRIGIYQIYFLTRVPPRSAVDESVNLVRPAGAKKAGFVNAVLRNAAVSKGSLTYPLLKEDPVKHVSIVYSHPEWMVRRWAERYGIPETIELCKANQAIPPKTIRVNTLAIERVTLMRELANEGFEVKESSYSLDGIEVLKGGRLDPKDRRFYVQDEASQIIPYLLSPGPGMTILDACSAPGGKTTHIAQLMDNSGLIYALDRNAKRLKSVEETAKRLGITIIKTIEADSEKPFNFTEPIVFDRILVDAPCSGLGVLRRTPDIKLKRKAGDIAELSARQTEILDNSSRYLKKGGWLVYSTCTFEPEETEDLIRRFLDTHKDFTLEDAARYLPKGCAGLVDKSGFLRTFPHLHGMDGFFAARLTNAGQ